jgi:hypothetical protein
MLLGNAISPEQGLLVHKGFGVIAFPEILRKIKLNV